MGSSQQDFWDLPLGKSSCFDSYLDFVVPPVRTDQGHILTSGTRLPTSGHLLDRALYLLRDGDGRSGFFSSLSPFLLYYFFVSVMRPIIRDSGAAERCKLGNHSHRCHGYLSGSQLS